MLNVPQATWEPGDATLNFVGKTLDFLARMLDLWERALDLLASTPDVWR
jgi:hypothetical protein